MAVTPKRASIDRSYPVWVGNLHEEVTDAELRQKFSGFGSLKSCVIKRDQSGRSKHFGYVSFHKKDVADRAAKRLLGQKLRGKAMKTKGPSALKKEGHLKKTTDFRPLTDCAFFIDSDSCKNGDKVSPSYLRGTFPLFVNLSVKLSLNIRYVYLLTTALLSI